LAGDTGVNLHVFSGRCEQKKQQDMYGKSKVEGGFESTQYYKRLTRVSFNVDDRAVQDGYYKICD